MQPFIIKLLILSILASCIKNKPLPPTASDQLNNNITISSINAGEKALQNKRKYQFIWSKNIIENKIYNDILWAWRSIDLEKGSWGSWTGSGACYGRKAKDSMKEVVHEIRVYKNGRYTINKNADWQKIKKCINEVYNNITNIKGPITFLTQNWYIGKHRVRRLKDFIDRYCYHYKCTHNEECITSPECIKFTEDTVIDIILGHIDSLSTIIPWVLIGQNSRQDKKKLKDYIKSAKAKLLQLKHNFASHTKVNKNISTNKIDGSSRSHAWKEVKCDLHNAKNIIKDIINDKNVCTKALYYVSWDRIEEHINTALNIVNEYIKLYH